MKAALIAGTVGLLFMGGGFWFGMRVMPVSKPHKTTELAQADAATAPRPEVITLDALKKTSESMMALNQALQVREQRVAEREQKAAQREDELAAEQQALVRSHENFKNLFGQFQQRLNLVESSQLEQLQRQAELYTSMGTAQSIELVRAMDDSQLARLFSVMETKPLSRLVGDWKTKYPADAPRLLHVLDGMALVLPKDKVAISDPTTASQPVLQGAPATDNVAAPDASAPSASPAAPTDSSIPPNANPAAPAADPNAAPAVAPASGTDATAPAAPPTNTPPASLAPPPDAPAAPVSTATTN